MTSNLLQADIHGLSERGGGKIDAHARLAGFYRDYGGRFTSMIYPFASRIPARRGRWGSLVDQELSLVPEFSILEALEAINKDDLSATSLAEVVRVDIRSIEEVPASPEHKGTVPVWWLYKPRELKGATAGGYLELVSEFEVKGGGSVHPHRHHTHEFYYVVSGRGRMTIEGETREIVQGDLVHIPPDAVHSLAPVSPHASIRCFCFAVGLRDTPEVNYSSE